MTQAEISALTQRIKRSRKSETLEKIYFTEVFGKPFTHTEIVPVIEAFGHNPNTPFSVIEMFVIENIDDISLSIEAQQAFFFSANKHKITGELLDNIANEIIYYNIPNKEVRNDIVRILRKRPYTKQTIADVKKVASKLDRLIFLPKFIENIHDESDTYRLSRLFNRVRYMPDHAILKTIIIHPNVQVYTLTKLVHKYYSFFPPVVYSICKLRVIPQSVLDVILKYVRENKLDKEQIFQYLSLNQNLPENVYYEIYKNTTCDGIYHNLANNPSTPIPILRDLFIYLKRDQQIKVLRHTTVPQDILNQILDYHYFINDAEFIELLCNQTSMTDDMLFRLTQRILNESGKPINLAKIILPKLSFESLIKLFITYKNGPNNKYIELINENIEQKQKMLIKQKQNAIHQLRKKLKQYNRQR